MRTRHRTRLVPIFVGLLSLPMAVATAPPANASCAFPYNLQNGQTADAGQVMADLNAIFGCLSVQRSYLAGLALSNDGTSPNTLLDVAAGMAADSSNASYITLAATLAKSTQGPWAAGANSNAMGTGLTIAANTWYHVFAIVNGGNTDVYFDTSASAANAPSGTTAFRRLGSFKTDGSAHILAFTQNGDEFLWKAPIAETGNTVIPTTATLYTLGGIPTGVEVWARLHGWVQSTAAGGGMLIQSPDVTSAVAGAVTGDFTAVPPASAQTGFAADIRVNTSAQVRWSQNSSGMQANMASFGWIDRRGRDL